MYAEFDEDEYMEDDPVRDDTAVRTVALLLADRTELLRVWAPPEADDRRPVEAEDRADEPVESVDATEFSWERVVRGRGGPTPPRRPA